MYTEDTTAYFATGPATFSIREWRKSLQCMLQQPFLCNYFLYIHIVGSAKHCRILLLWHFSEELKHVSVLTIIIFVKMLLI